MTRDGKYSLKWLLLGILIGSIMFLLMMKEERAEAAQTVSVNLNNVLSDYTVPDVYEFDWSEWLSSGDTSLYYNPEELPDLLSEFPYLMVTRISDNAYNYFFSKDPHILNITSSYQHYEYVPFASLLSYYDSDICVTVYVSDDIPYVYSVVGCSDIPVSSSFEYFTETIFSEYNCCLIGSNYDYIGDNTDSRAAAIKAASPYSNFIYPNLPEEKKTSVDIIIDDFKYTITEPYPYYLVLKDLYGNMQLFFSDIQFTGQMIDLYTRCFDISSEANVVSYYWNSGEQNDFIASRAVSVGFKSVRQNTSGDYMCNYVIPNTRSLLDSFLLQKLKFDNVDPLSLDTLCLNVPDEFRDCHRFIIFRQAAETAYDDRIIFYGWKDTLAELYINELNSQIVAKGKKGAVKDYITAYYDVSVSSWIITENVVLGATTDWSFSVPVIYYTNATLYVCDKSWENTGEVVRTASFQDPPFSINAEDSKEQNFLGKLFSGFKDLASYLFVPSPKFFDSRINYLKSRFTFYEAISSTGTAIVDFFTETDFSEPPKITVNLSAARSKYNYGDTAVCLDMSWYEEYKPYVDSFLSGVIWLVFAWNTFKNLPSIISGVTTAANVSTKIAKDSNPKDRVKR